MNIPLAYYWPMSSCERRVQESVLRQFAEAGADGINLNPAEFREMMGSAGEVVRWRKMMDATGVRFRDAHAPYGPLEDLSCPIPEAVPAMVATHRHCLELCAELGIGSCTIHVGRPTDLCRDSAVVHENALRALERILPEAERCRVVVCIENIWDPNNTAGMLLDAIERFRSPWLGVCWDSGHAQLSRSDAPDVPGQRCRASWRESGYPDGPDEWSDTGDYLRRLLPHVVTCHIHSNDRVQDRHWEPTDPRGLTDWAAEMPILLSAPRLMQLQNEALIGPDNPATVREHVESLRGLVERYASSTP